MNTKITTQYYLYKAGKLDPDAFAKVYDLFVDKIYRYVFFKVSSVQEAQDITSDVFLKTWEYLQDKEKKVDNLKALLYRIARNLIIDFYRKKERDDVIGFDFVPDEMISTGGVADFHKTMDVNFKTQEIVKIMAEMNDLYREVVMLRYIDQLSIKEIASIIKKSNGATRVLVHRSVAVLKELLEKHNK